MPKFWVLMLTITGVKKLEGGLDQLNLMHHNEETFNLMEPWLDLSSFVQQAIICEPETNPFAFEAIDVDASEGEADEA